MMPNRFARKPIPRTLDRRVCAQQYTYAALSERGPNLCLLTFFKEHSYCDQFSLLKLVPGIEVGRPVWLADCDLEYYDCKNVPAGLQGEGKLKDGQTFSVEVFPMLLGRDPEVRREGGAFIRLEKGEEEGALFAKLTSGKRTYLHGETRPYLCDSEGKNLSQPYEEKEGGLVAYMEEPGLYVAVKGDFQLAGLDSSDGAQLRFSSRQGTLLVGFAEHPDRAWEIASRNPEQVRTEILSYYQAMLDTWQLKTPIRELNEAFAHARLNLEYAWFRPYGWIESIRHWVTMWHMEQTAAEEWAENQERAKECLTSQMERLLDGDKVPDLCIDGTTRRDWGGNNQFFFREVEHYLRMTGDRDFAEKALQPMERILAQTFREYDPTGSGVIGWGTQIGNQEDFESTPGKGAGPGSEGVRMLEILGEVYRMLGDTQHAQQMEELSQQALCRLKKTLWQKDLGRFAWFRDSYEGLRLETSYHGIVYPILYGLLEDEDAVSALDHLEHRLTGKDGEMYQSNHFGEHGYYDVPTWGMQCGSDMQPFATAAYAKLGKGDQAIRPLSFIAKAVCSPVQGGSFPETAVENRSAYFSPSAGVFAQEVIESIFGLRRDEISGIGRFSPCFPRDWDRAELQLPKAGLAYQQKNGVHTFRLRMENGARKEFLWRLPPYGKITAKVDHQPAEVFTRKGCGWFEAKIQLGEKTEYLVEISYTPISFTLRYPKVAACGDKFSLRVEGGWLEGLDDRCGLFSQVAFGEQNQLQGVLREDLLEPYEKFGWFGRINCARRTLFLKLQAEGITFTWPVTVTLLPRLASSALLTEQGLCVTLSNCSATPISDNGSLLFGKECSVLPLRLEGKQEHRFCFPFSEQQRQAVTWGQNTAALRLGSLQVAIPFEGQPLASEGPRPVSLDKAGLVPAEHWEAIGKLPPNRSHMFTADFHLFMKGLLEENQTITPFPGLTMELNPKGFVPIDGADQRPVTISLSGLRGKKIYLLLSTFLTNHNIFSEVFRIQLETEQKEAYMRPIFNRTLCFPGQLDMGFSGRCIFGFPTFVEEEKRGELPQLPLEADCEDYPHVQPPEYPQHSLWSETKALQRNDTVFNLVELELGETRDLKELRIFPLQPDGAAGLFALSIE